MKKELNDIDKFVPKNKYLAVIPARSGSKRLPNKNILPLGGHPLISYTINSVKILSNLIDHIFTTDDENIREIALSYGAFSPFIRPKNLAGDNITNYDVMIHAINYLETKFSKDYDAYILLQPTSPFRSALDIVNSIKEFEKGDCPTLASVKGPFFKRHKIIKELSSKDTSKLVNVGNHKPIYIYNASIYITSKEYFFSNRKIHNSPESYYIMNEYAIDIDTKEDYDIANLIFERVNKNYLNKN